MKNITSIFLLSLIVVCGYSNNTISLGKWNITRLEHIIKESNELKTHGQKVKFLSKQFLDTRYKSNTLSSKYAKKEQLIINLEYMDCFTYIDYIEAMSLSSSYLDFITQIKAVRYKDGNVSYYNRNHFFTDWIDHNHYQDMAMQISNRAISIHKVLNQKQDKSKVLDSYVRDRVFSYILSKEITNNIIDKLNDGDIIGAYSSKFDWLDVTHVGFVIKKKGKVYFRNATSRKILDNGKQGRRVVDILLSDYLKRVRGLVILRRL